MKFDVNAGKYDGDERNCKYCDSFSDLDDALAAYTSVCSYPWAEITYTGRGAQRVVLNPYIPFGE